MDAATRASVMREGLEKFEDRDDDDSVDHNGATIPFDKFDIPVGNVGPELGTLLLRAGNIALQGRDSLFRGTVVLEQLRVFIGQGLGDGPGHPRVGQALHETVRVEDDRFAYGSSPFYDYGLRDSC